MGKGKLLPMLVACLALFAAGCGGDDDDSGSTGAEAGATNEAKQADVDTSTKPAVTLPDSEPTELVVDDIVVGDGAEAKSGDEVTVQYVGVGFDSEEEFDASWDRGEPFSFQLGAGMVIPGWDEGVAGMKVGGRRQLTIPADMAYGPQGSPPAIGPDETLVFVVDLVDVN